MTEPEDKENQEAPEIGEDPDQEDNRERWISTGEEIEFS